MVRKSLLAARKVEEGPEIEGINGDGDRPLMIHHNPLVPVNIGGRDRTDQQTELFYANCLICGRRVTFVIDNGSNTNLIAQRLIRDLQLHLTNVRPYQLSWIIDGLKVIDCEQCLIRLIFGGHYQDYVCSVKPVMNLLLGRPWQFDRGAIYNGQENSYTIQLSNLTVTLFSNVRNRNQGIDTRMLGNPKELELVLLQISGASKSEYIDP